MHRTSFTVQVWSGQMDMIKKAAKKQGSSIMEYVRSRFMPLVAEDLGVPLPEFPAFYKGRPSVQKEAAALLKMPVDQWRKEMLENAAQQVVKQLGSGAPTPQPVARRTKVGH